MAGHYLKQPLSAVALLELLKRRGLVVADEARALHYIKTIGYYRLSGYMYPLQQPGSAHRFNVGASFEDVLNSYEFDKQLRTIVMEYMERLEVVLRAKLTDCYSLRHGFFWYSQPLLFDNTGLWASIMKDVKLNFTLY